MSKRLQVLLEEAELREVQKAARRGGMTTAEWVRRAIRAAQRTKPLSDTGRKVDVIRVAGRRAFPAPGIEQMLAEIERGYGGGKDA